MNTWTIPGRIIGGFVALLLITLLVAGLSLRELRAMNSHMTQLATGTVPSIVTLDRIVQSNASVRRTIRQLVIDAAGDPQAWEAAKRRIAELRREGDDLAAGYRTRIADAREQTLFAAATTARGGLLAAAGEIIDLVGRGQLEQATDVLRTRGDAADRECTERFNTAIDHNVRTAEAQATAAGGRVRTSFVAITSAAGLDTSPSTNPATGPSAFLGDQSSGDHQGQPGHHQRHCLNSRRCWPGWPPGSQLAAHTAMGPPSWLNEWRFLTVTRLFTGFIC